MWAGGGGLSRDVSITAECRCKERKDISLKLENKKPARALDCDFSCYNDTTLRTI